jgi:glutamyl-tRNA synthetase
MSQIVTRFAPSPTGFLHIGGARTALFNWLYAKRFGGTFLLRIEDTDRERSTEAAVAAILDGLKWLGIDWDGEAISQFTRVERHREVVDQMLASAAAYRCYASTEELEEMRQKARLEGKPMRYDGRWRDRDPSEAPPGVAPVIRLRAAQEGETVIDDKVQGKVVFANKDLDDLVLLRSDGNPTYMLAVVVDDHDMAVTHVIRGDDHLTNAARQTQIYQALGWDVPVWAHIPLIHGPDGAKLSKRHGALGVDAYRALGYLPAALRNYLVRLGWSHGDKEFFTEEELIAAFDLSSVGRSASRFDFAKLENMNGHFMRASSDQDLYDALIGALPYLPGGSEVAAGFDDRKRAELRAAIPGLKERAKTLVELLDGAGFLFAARPLAMDEKAADILAKGGRAHLAVLLPKLREVGEWSGSALEAVVRAYAEGAGAKLGAVAQPLRAALTGRSTSPGIFDVLTVLGREESLGRIADQAKP